MTIDQTNGDQARDDRVRQTLGWLGDRAGPPPTFERFEEEATVVAGTGTGRASRPHHRSDRRLAFLAGVAATLVVVGGFWALTRSGDQQVETGPTDPGPTSTSPTPQPGANDRGSTDKTPNGGSDDTAPAGATRELLIWLDAGVTGDQVAAIAERLQSLTEMSELRYVDFGYIDTDQTWAEFSEHFADEPEILELVEPEQLPTSFHVVTPDPDAVIEAVERLPGVDQIDETDPTIRFDRVADHQSRLVADPASLAEAAGARVIVYGGPGGYPEGWGGHLIVWRDGVTTRIGPFNHPRVSRGVIIDRGGDSGPTLAYDLDGNRVCETHLPDESWVHHATTRSDGTVVLGFDRPVGDRDDPSGFRYEAFAHDCETGERTPIASFRSVAGEVETLSVERIGGRVFQVETDAEGNSSSILNEDGVNLVGEDDYAGWIIWSADGSILVYSDHGVPGSPGPHYSNHLAVRDTRTGDLLWRTELPQLISRLDMLGDRLVVGLGDHGTWGLTTERVAVFDLRRGEEAGVVQVVDDVPAGLIYLG